jgi:saccharopine dehydrogenase-like NADP-dependent oxidoreductase
VHGYDQQTIKDPSLKFPIYTLNVSDTSRLQAALAGKQAVVSCLPFDVNVSLARAALMVRQRAALRVPCPPARMLFRLASRV